MRTRRMRITCLSLAAAVGMLAPSPVYACHEATGWCCNEIGTNYYCCYWKDNVLQTNTCGWIDPT